MPSLINTAILTLLTTTSALAAPFPNTTNPSKGSNDTCLTSTTAQQVATNYANLIRLIPGWETLATATLSEHFTDYSESVNTLIDSCPQGAAAHTLPLLSPSFTNRTSFITGQGQQAPIDFNQLNLWWNCDTVFLRWETTNTVANITHVRPVVGMITLETCAAPEGHEVPYLIDTVYSEFDAGAWLQNLVDAGVCPGGGDPDSSDGIVDGVASAAAVPAATPSAVAGKAQVAPEAAHP